MKTCTKCSQPRPLDEFGARVSHGRRVKDRQCRTCRNQQKAEWRIGTGRTLKQTWRPEAKPRRNVNISKEGRECTTCATFKPWADFHRSRVGTKGHITKCKACVSDYQRQRTHGILKDGDKKAMRYRNHREANRRRRLAAINALGGKCACCGESTYEFLSFDHINNDGAEHRRTTSNQSFLAWLKRNDYARDRIQILCHNCNMAKGFYGECPHERARRKAA